jgi:hypothetical protein
MSDLTKAEIKERLKGLVRWRATERRKIPGTEGTRPVVAGQNSWIWCSGEGESATSGYIPALVGGDDGSLYEDGPRKDPTFVELFDELYDLIYCSDHWE